MCLFSMYFLSAIIWHGMTCYAMTWYEMAHTDTVCSDMAWHGMFMTLYGMLSLHRQRDTSYLAMCSLV